MRNNLIPFAFEDALIRAHLDEDGNLWFVARDVCRVLGLENSRDAISNLEDDEKADVDITDTSSNGVTQQRKVNIISESGLYSLVFRSRKPQAKAFSKWVRSEVLPSIRKTGSYTIKAAAPLRMPRLSMDDLPEDLLHVRPYLRKQALDFAMQAARIGEVTDLEDVHNLFVDYCRILCGGGALPGGSGHDGEIMAFIKSRLVPKADGRLFFNAIYKAFRRWWYETREIPAPSQKAVAQALGVHYHSSKSNRMLYHGVTFAENA